VGGGGNAIQLVNARQGKAYGFELDSEWMVSENLQLTAGYSYNHTRIQDSALAVAVCAQCTVRNPLNAAGRALVDGNPFPQAPRTIFTATARYSVPVGAQGEVFAYTDWSVQGATNLFLYESREFNTSGNFEGGLKVGYARTDGTWEVALFARNLTNEHNLQGGIDFNNNTGFVNDPRFYGVSFHTALR
jgi:iron complex outermembrane receptor protein